MTTDTIEPPETGGSSEQDPDDELAIVHQSRRLDIDGLRGVAVLAVLAYHYFPSAVRGGFVGVDVFFVISGFVITNLLVRQRSLSRSGLGGFWGHRVRRILPALVLVLAVTLVAGWFILWPAQLQLLGITTTWSAAMMANILLWTMTGYFGTEPTANPLLNLWSLGIEEQFYVVWPVLVLVLIRFARRRAVAVVAILGALSWLACLTWPNIAQDSERALSSVFFLPWFRGWELLAGSILAVILARRSPTSISGRGARVARASYWLALGALIVFLVIPYSNRNPAQYALPAVVATAVLIGLGALVRLDSPAIAGGPLLWFGRISYPLYLWHWPLLSFALALGLAESPWQLVVLTAVATLLAWLTMRFVETPIRRQRVRTSLVLLIVGATLLVGALGWLVGRAQGFPSRATGVAAELAAFSYDPVADNREGTCFDPSGALSEPWPAQCLPTGATRPQMLVWGDSHAAQLRSGLEQQLGQEVGVSQVTQGSCPPASDLGAGTPECVKARRTALDVATSGGVDTVILAGNWSEDDLAGVADSVNTIRSESATAPQIILVGPVPLWNPSLPRAWTFLEANRMTDLPEYSSRGLDQERFALDTRMRELAADLDITYVSPMSELCRDRECRARAGAGTDSLTAWDAGHLTPAGSAIVAKAIKEQLVLNSGQAG